jgi:asparagine synthase (glutamine-hydrolysing)
MSAIVGIYHRHRSVDRAHLEAMVDILAHRGKDGVGLWCESSVGLGHRLLWTTPESLRESFPLVNAAENLILTADARIDNREELIAQLNLDDDAITDSQLILAAYSEWGDRTPEYLLGDFAFAIWDSDKQQLFCARDHFGVKPFYYYHSEHTFAFATEMKALFCLPEVSRELNQTRIAEHLSSEGDSAETTFYQQIWRLPPAHHLTVSVADLQLQSYWQLDPTRELRLESDQAYAEQFLALFTEAVRCRLRSAFPIGSMLSGGLDSSSITCVARQILRNESMGDKTLHTFSARFDQVPECDESLYQDAVLQQGDLIPHLLQADQRGPLTDSDAMIWHQDEAIDAGNLYLGWGLYSQAKADQVRVILDGFDGDTTVSHGNEYLRELAQTGQWIKLWNETKAYGERFKLPWKRVFINWLWRYGIKQSLKKWQTSKASAAPMTDRENHYRLLSSSVMPHILEILDRSASAFAIELRFPFFDKRLVEFCLSLPPDQKLSQGWGRIVMRRAMAGVLPEVLQWRVDKANLHPSFERGLRVFELQKFGTMLWQEADLLEGYVDRETLQQQYDRFVAGSATEPEVNALWRSLTLGLWLRRHASSGLSLRMDEEATTQR